MSSNNFGLSAVALFCAAVIVAGCGGSQQVVPNDSSKQVLERAKSVNGIIAHVNDVPRMSNMTNMAPLKAAAHARGLWLTAELNKPRIKSAQSGGMTEKNDSRTRTAQLVNRNTCDTCDPSGGGSSNGASWQWFDDSAGTYPYDTEIDYTDGTSSLYEQFTMANGDQVLTMLNPDASYTVVQYYSVSQPYIVSRTVSTPQPQITPAAPPTAPGGCTIAIVGGYEPPHACDPFKVPKWICPVVGGAASVGTGLIKTRLPIVGAIGAAFVGEGLRQICESQT